MKEEKELTKIDITSTTAEKALDFLKEILLDPLKDGVGVLKDRIESFRIQNRVDIVLKAKKAFENKGLKFPKKIPIKDITTLLEYASFEDNDEMQNKWASLLVNTIDPNNKFNSNHVFSQLLNQLSVNEIYILNFLFSMSFIQSNDDRPYYSKSKLIKISEVNYHTGLLLMDNLIRLSLVEKEPPKLKLKPSPSITGFNLDDNISPYYDHTEDTDQFRLSKLGEELVRQINLYS